jgi:hypothetical protein
LQRRGDTAVGVLKQVVAAPLQNKKEDEGRGLRFYRQATPDGVCHGELAAA